MPKEQHFWPYFAPTHEGRDIHGKWQIAAGPDRLPDTVASLKVISHFHPDLAVSNLFELAVRTYARLLCSTQSGAQDLYNVYRRDADRTWDDLKGGDPRELNTKGL